MTYPEQPAGQQLPVCENGHPMTTVDSACPLCGAGQRQGGPAGGPQSPSGPQQGYPAPSPGLSQFPAPGGYYQPDGFAPEPSGAYPPAAGYSSQAAGGYQASPWPGYWQQPVYAAAGRTNVLAIVSLVAGILWFFWLGSIVALVCGLVALRQIKARNEGGRGIAIAGIVLAAIGMVTLAATIALIAIGTHTTPANGT